MNYRCRTRLFWILAAVAMSLLALPAVAAEVPDPLPDPDGKPADMSKPVKVYILMGQSNMLGFGRVGPADKPGTLEYMIKEKGKYPYLVDDAGAWTVRNDVRYVRVMQSRDRMGVHANQFLTVQGNFGPELGFGHVMGYTHDEPVLILKSCIGNRSLGWDLLPPGSERFTFEGKTYAGYKDHPTDEILPRAGYRHSGNPNPWYGGKQYDDDTANAKRVLKNLADYYPGYEGQGYEVAGFVFWQGHKDQNPVHASRYEQNLVRFIKALREDFEAPEAKFVLATIAFGGQEIGGHGLTIVKAQLAVDGDAGNYPEFKGNVTAVDARPFWRDADVSPSGQGYHYNHNAETYTEVGEALGRAMAELLDSQSQREEAQ